MHLNPSISINLLNFCLPCDWLKMKISGLNTVFNIEILGLVTASKNLKKKH